MGFIRLTSIIMGERLLTGAWAPDQWVIARKKMLENSPPPFFKLGRKISVLQLFEVLKVFLIHLSMVHPYLSPKDFSHLRSDIWKGICAMIVWIVSIQTFWFCRGFS